MIIKNLALFIVGILAALASSILQYTLLAPTNGGVGIDGLKCMLSGMLGFGAYTLLYRSLFKFKLVDILYRIMAFAFALVVLLGLLSAIGLLKLQTA